MIPFKEDNDLENNTDSSAETKKTHDDKGTE